MNNRSVSTLLSAGPALNNSYSVKYFSRNRYAKELPAAGKGGEGGVPEVLIWENGDKGRFPKLSSLQWMRETC